MNEGEPLTDANGTLTMRNEKSLIGTDGEGLDRIYGIGVGFE